MAGQGRQTSSRGSARRMGRAEGHSRHDRAASAPDGGATAAGSTGPIGNSQPRTPALSSKSCPLSLNDPGQSSAAAVNDKVTLQSQAAKFELPDSSYPSL